MISKSRTGFLRLPLPGIAILAAALVAPPATAAPDSTPAPETRAWYASGAAALAQAKSRQQRATRAQNLIFFLGDGMGVSTVTAGRIMAGQLRGGSGEENLLAFEALPVAGLVKTYNTNQQVPDSAGTMTAIVTGVKTRAATVQRVSSTRSRRSWSSRKRRATSPAWCRRPASPTRRRPRPTPGVRTATGKPTPTCPKTPGRSAAGTLRRSSSSSGTWNVQSAIV